MLRREFLAATAAGVATQGLFRTAPGSGLVGRLMSGSGADSPIDAATFHAMRKFASTSFGRIAYVERGQGPVALFLHGDPLCGFQWRGALERLSPLRRCIAPDFMGLGYSEISEKQSVAPEAQAEMLVALLDSFKIDSVDLVGSDSGGAVSQILVAHHPRRVRTLLLTNCDTSDDSPPPKLLPIIEAARKGTLVEETSVAWLADKEFGRKQLGTAYTDPKNLTDESLEVYCRPATTSALKRTQYNNYQIALDRNALLPIVPELKKCQVPVRLVWGTGDDIFKQSNPDILAQTFPRFRGTRKVEGAKLFFPEEFPDLIAEEARNFWRG